MNRSRKRKKTTAKDKIFEEWRADRDEAVASLDLQKFKAFCLKWQGRGAYKTKPLPTDEVCEIAMYKMACEIASIPEDIALKAAEWLFVRGYVPGIRWDVTVEQKGGAEDETCD